MLKTAIICPDAHLRDQLEKKLSSTGRINILRVFDRYPDALEVARFARVRAPQLVFLSMETLKLTLETLRTLEAELPGVQVVAIHRDHNQQGLLEMVRAGVRDCLFLPFEAAEISEVLDRVCANLEKRPISLHWTGSIFSFLPSKPGSGSSTIAMNTSTAMAKLLDERVLLADFDLTSGMMRFMLKLTQANSVKEAAEWAPEMDESVWPRLVTTLGNLDVLHAGPIGRPFRMESADMRHMAEFWSSMYGAVCVDLSGSLEQHSLDVMHESKQIFLVCTPETASVHQAKEKLAYLNTLDLGERVRLIINRHSKNTLISPSQIEKLVGAPVQAVLGNDYDGVQKALQDATAVNSASALGKQFASLAASISGKTPAASESSSKQRIGWLSNIRLRTVSEAKA